MSKKTGLSMSNILVKTLLFSIIFIGEAHAYIDPNMGGTLFQILTPILLAIVAAWAVVKHKFIAIISWFKGSPEKQQSDKKSSNEQKPKNHE